VAAARVDSYGQCNADWEGVVVTYSVRVRHEVFDLLCAGVPLIYAVPRVGVSPRQATDWWRQAGGMALSKELPLAAVVEGPGGLGHRLSLEERIAIMRGRDRGQGCAEIGRQIGRDKSVVWREVRRNADPQGDYHAGLAHRRAVVRARRPKGFKLADPELRERVTGWMDQGWSPRLIARVLAVEHDRLARVSHETIYQSLYVQTRGHLRADLHRCLSTRRAARKRRGEVSGRPRPYAEAFTISDRPAEVADRAVPGHWEGDLIMGAVGCGAIGTLVERTTRFTILLHLPHGHGADEVAATMITAMQDLPAHLRRTITWDRGIELARYRDIEMQLQAPVYFCDPHSPWQRGSNENTNRLLRFWFAKSSDLRVHTAADLKRVQDLLNTRPRPTLNLDTPAHRLHNLINQAA
jgi:IS30 family transposase